MIVSYWIKLAIIIFTLSLSQTVSILSLNGKAISLSVYDFYLVGRLMM